MMRTRARLRTLRRLSCVLALSMIAADRAAAQPMQPVDDKAEVFRDQIFVAFPLPYLHVKRPDPPVAGFYAWRASFGGEADMTVVLRADTALRSSSNRAVVRASSLRRCPADAKSVMDCTLPLRGNARAGIDVITLQITDPDFVALVRQRHPEAIVRHAIEPGGRFRVDHIGIRYR